MSTMNVSLTPHLEKLVLDRVKSGRYTSASEVIRLLEQRDRHEDQDLSHLKSVVDAGLKQLDAGGGSPVDEAAVERIKRRGRAKLAEFKSATD